MWFLSKVNYKIQDWKGNWKSLSEQFIQDGITYGEVEEQLHKLLEGRVTDYEYDINKIKFGAVYESFNAGNFYKVSIEEKTIDAKGKDKVTTLTHYVVAEDVSQAEARATQYMKSWITSTTIVGAVKTKVLGVWHPHNSLWQDDFKQRMAKLAEEGHESNDVNQTTIFDADGNPKMPDDDGYTVTTKDKNGNDVDITDKLKKSAKKGSGITSVTFSTYDPETGESIELGTIGKKPAVNSDDPTIHEEVGEKYPAKKKPKSGITFRKHNGDPVDA